MPTSAPLPPVAAFLTALRAGVSATYPWAQTNPAQLDSFMRSVDSSLRERRTGFVHTGVCVTAAWRAIGLKGKPTWKALFSLPRSD